MGKTLIITGLTLAAIGVLLTLFQNGGFPRLPGDIYIEREGFTFYFPLGWCIVFSIVLSVIFGLFGK